MIIIYLRHKGKLVCPIDKTESIHFNRERWKISYTKQETSQFLIEKSELKGDESLGQVDFLKLLYIVTELKTFYFHHNNNTIYKL